ncbi:MAG: MFS transporter [Planctomycetes bacterium]|nr:MFS transporter [Planctomycetota bacterium]
MNDKLLIFRWKQLFAVTVAHLIIDMFAGMLPTILPAIQTQFALTVAQGALILGTLNFTCNLVQVLTGHLRPDKKRPFFMHLGFMLAAAICLIAVLPRSADSMPAILILAVVTAIGVAILHPEGMRAIHILKPISASMTTSVFMAGGFVGISVGMLIAPILVTRFGLEGLYFLLLCPAVGMALIYFLRIKLAVEKPRSIQKTAEKGKLSFWPIMIMAIPATTATTIIAWILPMRLHELGFELTFGGICSMVFCVGGALGSFFWSKVADKKGPLFCSIIASLLGIPLLICHQATIEHKSAILFLFFAGFGSIAAYPLIATVARYTSGPNLGMRMSLIVGGAWGIASLIQMLIGYFAEQIGLHNILLYSSAGYLISAVIGFVIFKHIRNVAGDFSGIIPAKINADK